MSSSLVVAIIVVVGAALTISLALNANDSNGGPDSASSSRSELASVQAEAARLGIVSGCKSSGGQTSSCQCIADQILAAGYDTIGETADLATRLEQASPGDYSALPADVAAAIGPCAG